MKKLSNARLVEKLLELVHLQLVICILTLEENIVLKGKKIKWTSELRYICHFYLQHVNGWKSRKATLAVAVWVKRYFISCLLFTGKIMNYYVKMDERTFLCKCCSKFIRGSPTSTGNLYSHIRKRHVLNTITYKAWKINNWCWSRLSLVFNLQPSFYFWPLLSRCTSHKSIFDLAL